MIIYRGKPASQAKRELDIGGNHAECQRLCLDAIPHYCCQLASQCFLGVVDRLRPTHRPARFRYQSIRSEVAIWMLDIVKCNRSPERTGSWSRNDWCRCHPCQCGLFVYTVHKDNPSRGTEDGMPVALPSPLHSRVRLRLCETIFRGDRSQGS